MTTTPGCGPSPDGSKTSTGGSDSDAIAVSEAYDRVDGAGRDLVEQRGGTAGGRGDLARAVDDRLEDELAGLARREHRHAAVRARGLDHRRAHERHVYGGPRDALVRGLGRGRGGERVERGLRGEVGGEADARADLGAHGRDVDDVAFEAVAHAGEQAEDEAHRAEVVERHGALEVVLAVI